MNNVWKQPDGNTWAACQVSRMSAYVRRMYNNSIEIELKCIKTHRNIGEVQVFSYDKPIYKKKHT